MSDNPLENMAKNSKYFTGINLYQEQEGSRRDKSRAFRQTQKEEILFQQNNKCARCHKKLDPRDIEYDHIKPWAANGKTATVNGAALCGSCHNKKTHEERLRRLEPKKRKKSSNKKKRRARAKPDQLGLGNYKLPGYKFRY